MKSEILDNISQYASINYESQILNSREYKEFVKNITELQEDIRQLNLPEEQINLIKRLLKEHNDLALDYVEKIYKQGLVDCVVLLRELKVIT